MGRRLMRSTRDRKIMGVCGGIAEYLHIDSTIVRIIWALAVCCFGSGILLYFIAGIIMPQDFGQQSYSQYNRNAYRTGNSNYRYTGYRSTNTGRSYDGYSYSGSYGNGYSNGNNYNCNYSGNGYNANYSNENYDNCFNNNSNSDYFGNASENQNIYIEGK
ncbi:MAG: PspC domain-containing protein [Lachnospiraceae bacterium]|nr:PspC domain-containing protein [Lachnospiraceae bacterium]